ncbi:MAG: DUF4199 domain-containing protein [Bacteroidia bacterium]
MNKFKTEIRWAFIFIIATILWMVLEKAVGLHDVHIEKHPTYTMLYLIPAILIYVFALRSKRIKDFGGIMTYKQGFITGLIMTAIVTIFSPLTQWVISEIITPDYFDTVIAYTVEHGMKSQEEAEAYFNLKSYMIQSTIWSAVMGIVFSAIVAIFTRKS